MTHKISSDRRLDAPAVYRPRRLLPRGAGIGVRPKSGLFARAGVQQNAVDAADDRVESANGRKSVVPILPISTVW